jgi:flagellar motor component MotA
MAEDIEEDFEEDFDEYLMDVPPRRARGRRAWAAAVGRLLSVGADADKDAALDLLCLLYELFKLARTKGDLALESHVERPEQSPVFARHPGVTPGEVEFVCDTLRMFTLGVNDPVAVRRMQEADLASRGLACPRRRARLRLVVEATVGHADGYAPQVSVEFARRSLPPRRRPSFFELEEALMNILAD